MTRIYTVFYTRTVQGEIDVRASSPTEAQEMVETGAVDFGHAREYTEPIEVYDVTG
jgi:hypothetical protein